MNPFEGLFSALFQQILGSPASALILIPVSIFAFVLEVWPLFPSKLVLPMCLVAGSCLFPGLVAQTTVPPAYPNPLLVLILNGFVLGFIAWVVHKVVVRRIIKWAGVNGAMFPSKQKGDTDRFTKPPTPPQNPT